MNKLKVIKLGGGYAWLDTGTYDSLIEAAMFVKTVEDRMGLMISAPEEIAYREGEGFITLEDLKKLTDNMSDTQYRDYLLKFMMIKLIYREQKSKNCN